MIALATLLLGLAAVSPPADRASARDPAPRIPSRSEIKARIAACGVPSPKIAIVFDSELQEAVVRIARQAPPPGDAQLDCVARASLRSLYYVQFKDGNVQARYDPVYWRLQGLAARAEATKWVEAHGLAPLPVPQPGHPPADYMHAVERLCGIEQGMFLAQWGDHMLTIQPDALGRITDHGFEAGPVGGDRFECILNVMTATDLAPYGLSFGFIGNERYVDE